MDELHAVGSFFASSTAPWWAVLGIPLVTFWLGQKYSTRTVAEQRIAAEAENERQREHALEMVREERTAEQRREREQRVFDHKRAAHAGFLDEFTAQENALLRVAEKGGGPPLEQGEYMVPLAMKLNAVDIYGSINSAIKARELCLALIEWVDAAAAEVGPRFKDMRDAKQAYTFAARGDLGIVDPPDMSDFFTRGGGTTEDTVSPDEVTN